MYLYHMVIGEKDSDIYISPQNALNEGLSRRTATRWYGNGGNFFPELTDRFRPQRLPKWIDFKNAVGADFEPPDKPYFRFPVFSERILVFNFDISSDLFAHIEDIYDGGKGRFVEGLPSKEDLIKQYWDSMTTIDEYLEHKPFKNPQIVIFETVPGNLIEYIE
ncbi:MAG TPA: hypothetical protein GX497_02810 [Bacillus bacterium]|nr:hypothetical protein [Bacillus sp. (in: firmicutes)]